MNIDLSNQEIYYVVIGLRTVYEHQKKIIENMERNKAWNPLLKIDVVKANHLEVKNMLDKFHLVITQMEGETNVT